MTESSTPATPPVQPEGRCARQVCALDDQGQRTVRPCVREAGHDGVCRYDGGDAARGSRSVVAHVTIKCPTWCTTSPGEHVEDLWNHEANCIHTGPVTRVKDDPAVRRPMRAPEAYPDTLVTFSTVARFDDGREVEAPVFWIDDREFSLVQAERLAEAVTAALALYRASAA